MTSARRLQDGSIAAAGPGLHVRSECAAVYPNQFIPGIPDYLTTYPPPPAGAPGRSVYEVLYLPVAVLRRFMAVHEAGHADAALRVPNVTVFRTGLRPGLGRLGSDADAGFTDIEGHCPWLTAAAISAAGEQAQQRWLGQNDLGSPVRLWATEIIAAPDRQKAIANIAPTGVSVAYDFDGIREEPDGSITAGWRAIRSEAARIVSAAWEDILVLAEAIDHRGELSGQEAGRLIRPS